MRSNKLTSVLIKSGLASLLLLAGSAAFAQVVNLTAKSTTVTLPDGTNVPMWGYFCNDAGSAATRCALAKGASTAAPPVPWVATTLYAVGQVISDGANVQRVAVGGTSALAAPAWATTPGTTTTDGSVTWIDVGALAYYAASYSATWAPPVITVATGSPLTINLTNNLSFPAGSVTPTATVPTSIVIVGQLGGGLGTTATSTLPTDHSQAQKNVTWFVAGVSPSPSTHVPVQGNRVQSFAMEIAAAGATLTTGQSASGTGITWPSLKPGTYLIESGTHPSIQGPMGLYGILVVTTAPATGAPGCAYPGAGTAPCVAPYSTDIAMLLSEIDPLQNNAVQTAVNTAGFSETKVWSGLPGGCGNPTSGVGVYQTCYPPAVNYTPLYYLVNGVGFNKTNGAASLFPTTMGTTALPVTGNVLVRIVNAGLRMHVPAIVGALTGGNATANPVVPAVSGFGLIAEDGNPLPGVTRVQNEVFMAAGKTYDVTVNVPATTAPATVPPALPIYDRELSLSGNATARDAGMLAYIGVNGAALPAGANSGPAVARADTYSAVIACTVLPCKAVVVADPAKGLVANDTNVYGVQVLFGPTSGALTLNANGTFTYVPNVGTNSDSFTYCANGSVTAGVCSSGVTAAVALNAATVEPGSGISVGNITFTSNIATSLQVASPGVLAAASDGAGYPLTVNGATAAAPLSVPLTSGAATGTAIVDANGGIHASVSAAGTYTFSYAAKNSQGTVSATSGTVTLIFPPGSGLTVSVMDGKDKSPITDYRWIIEEDRTFYVDPNCTTNPPAAGCPGAAGGIVPTFGTSFHTSFMPVVALGCTGTLSCKSGQTLLGVPAVCDVGNGVCRTSASQETAVDPKNVNLDPTKRYYLSVLPGDAANPQVSANASADCVNGVTNATTPGNCGHGLGGAPIAAHQNAVTVLTQPTPFPTAKLTVFVFEDDFPLNGEQDGGGGIDILSPIEAGLGQFNIRIMDDAGGPGDATGQVDYDMFNQPLSNSLAGTIDPNSGLDACPISTEARIGQVPTDPTKPVDPITNPLINDKTQTGITGTIITCPKYESDGRTLSPIAGQAVVANMMPGRYGIVATPGADRIAKGEEWLQTNTLDGQKAHDSFLRIGEPSFFQEFGPAGFHVSIGFANPAIINGRLAGVCAGDAFLPGSKSCGNTISGRVTTNRMSRTPDQRLYSSGSRASFTFTQCYVSVGDADGEDFAFTKCDKDGNFSLSGLPDGEWRITTFDQWNDQLVDGLSTPVRLGSVTPVCPGTGSTQYKCNIGDIAANQWQANFLTRSFIDINGDGVSNVVNGVPSEPGLALVKTNVRFRDGSYSNRNNTDLNGFAAFNEEFPLFSWYVIETDVTRYKNTGTHVVYDAGGPADGSADCVPGITAPCGASTIADHLANTNEQISLPSDLRIPGAVYCSGAVSVGADCTGLSIASGPITGGSSGPTCSENTTTGVVSCGGPMSTGRIDPPWVLTEAWQGFSGQNSFLEFGKKPYVAGENGGIRGHVVYASTRPYDDPQFGTQNVWEPLVPGVTINLYQEGTAPDGSPSLTLVDHTTTSSWDAWAQGSHLAADGTTKIPNMNCPGQGRDTGTDADPFFFTLKNQPQWLDFYSSQHGGPAAPALPYNAQFKCYDGMHNWNQMQAAPYDGMYQFPSVTGLSPTTGKPVGTNCSICKGTTGTNPDTTDPYRTGTPMLPRGKYVVEVVMPAGYAVVKEEDKNILMGDNFIAPVTVQFPGLGGAIYILPDQAEVSSAYNANNVQNSTNSMGRSQTLTSHEGDTATVSTFWPCVGATRIVPDYMSQFPMVHEVAAFAGATRNLCDRKEVILDDQTSAQAEFLVFTPTHVASHFTGVITDDFTSEFDPFSPQFGEKFSPANLPVSIKDWAGNEITRVYSDEWGSYDGLTYSTWEVNPPNPTGYAPTMMGACMNDAGPIPDPLHPGQTMNDPLYNAAYSQFCYEIPFMPGNTQYMDTPVTPTSAFAGAGYNNPDCAYPDATPAIKEVDGDGVGPWVSATGARKLTITALGDQTVNNYGYSGPSATTAPFNVKTVGRHYGFGATQGTGSAVLVGANGVSRNLTITSWSDTVITGTVPTNVPLCPMQQQAQYQLPLTPAAARCGQLVITAGNGKQSIDTVTVTIGGKPPTHILASASVQTAIDKAAPGDLLIVDPTCTTTALGVTTQVGCAPAVGAPVPAHSNSAHNELLLMWKPVRLQGVGAVSSVLNANTHPAGKLDDWRRRVNCLFGLTISGAPISTANPYDPTGKYSCDASNGWAYFKPYGTTSGVPFNPQIDRLPLEATVGWDANLNGNLAELLQEPSLMGALEGAGITVLAKGVKFASNPFDPTLLAGFPVGTPLLTAGSCATSNTDATNPFSSNFQCNPSSIDGLTITNSSQGGGGIFVHGWGHNIQIANNRVQNNSGTLSGGINIGQGEFPPAYLVGAGAVNSPPGSCQSQQFLPANKQLPYCFDLNVNVHHNAVLLNSSTGDELFSATPAGAGGVSFCTGSDYYKFNYNWVCGNLSTGDGGGLGHLGYSWNGDIEHNSVLFNQSTNPTIATNGGGVLIYGAPDVDPPCAAATDIDCVGPANLIGPSDGAGPGLVINANLIMGNAAESGSGGGLRFHNVNGSEVVNFPTTPSQWYSPKVTNNIIVNNVAGWDGGGISLQDSLAVNIINNTIASNDTTASAGVLFNTVGAPLASSQGPCPVTRNVDGTCPVAVTTSVAQPAGLVSTDNSSVLIANLPATVTCPAGHYAPGTAASNGTCRSVSYPLLQNNVFWQNRMYYIGVGNLAPGTQNQQHLVTLYKGLTTAQPASQTRTGECVTSSSGVPDSSFWDIGVRGDTGPGNHASTVTLAPNYSILTNTGASSEVGLGANDFPGATPGFVTQYCNGARTPPENGGLGYIVPPGIADATVPNPIFSLTPAATVDEGNNWINISWGPLSTTNPALKGTGNANFGTGLPLGNYSLAALTSPAVDAGNEAGAPERDFFGTTRPQGPEVDIGAMEFTQAAVADLDVAPQALAFGRIVRLRTSPAQFVTLSSAGSAPLSVTGLTFTAGFARAPSTNANCSALPITLAAGSTCRIYIAFTPGTVGPVAGSLTVVSTDLSADRLADSVVALTGTGIRLGVAPGSLFFFTFNGNLSAAQAVTVTNYGPGALTGISFVTSGVTNGVTFTAANAGNGAGCGAGLPAPTNSVPTPSCRVNVRFQSPTPFTVGTGNLNFADIQGDAASVGLTGVRIF